MTSVDLFPWNSAPGRSIDIELGGQEVINIELDNLDSNADDVLEVLKEGQPKVAYWTRLAGEYMRRGHLDAAEKIALSAIESAFCTVFCILRLNHSRQVFNPVVPPLHYHPSTPCLPAYSWQKLAKPQS
jgi:hypothetical protein